MKISTFKSTWIATGFGIALLAGLPALADDTELLLLNPDPASNPKPNILFILDTSGSMSTPQDTLDPYDETNVYGGSCDPDRIYWTDVDVIPDCSSSTNYFDDSDFFCDAATLPLNGIGSYTGTMVQYRAGGNDGLSGGPATWQYIVPGYNSSPVECQADNGVHGDGRATYLWPANGTNLADPFTNDTANQMPWGSAPRNLSYTVYDGNYLNWKSSPVVVSMTRADIMKVVTKKVLSSMTNMNVGLMRFNQWQGGVVTLGIQDLDANRPAILAMVDTYDPWWVTPLAESMYEAALYWLGLPAQWGGTVVGAPTAAGLPTDPAVLASTSPDVYKAPAWDACAKNYNILLSDGVPVADADVPGLIGNLPGFAAAMGSPTCANGGDGACLEDISEYLSVYDLDPLTPGDQLVTTHTIGFINNIPILERTAENSGGEYFRADDVESLTKTLIDIFANINDRTLSFTAPAVSVNTFNRTRNFNDLYITVFGAKAKTHWPGNLKKYRITDTDPTDVVSLEVTDANDDPAVDPATGFFLDTATSFWSATIDGNDARKGGAANDLPNPSSRNLYTDIAGPNLTLAGNAVSPGNLGAFSDSDFGLTGATGEPSKEDVIRWARGEDLRDTNPSSTIRYEMGDPLHSQPAAIVYGGTPTLPDTVVYMATNDGYLHAIDGETGVELWSFIPKQLLSNLTRLYFDPNAKYKQYGIDGNIVSAVKDVDRDGVIEPADGDFVYILFGMRRGGNTLFALDVTDKNSPEMLWDISLPEFAQTWSAPVVSRMDIGSVTQNSDKAVVVVGGGYNTVHDTADHPAVADGIGAGIHILDLASGAELWRTGSDVGADLRLSAMTRSIATEVRVIDFSGDGLADRMYASDMGGRIWRFDVTNGRAPATLVTGGVIAELGADGAATVTAGNTRRFFNAPDVSLFTDDVQQRRYIAISIGSGYRAHPFDLSASDRFFSIRDPDVFTKLPQSAYDTYSIVQDTDLVEISGQSGVVITSSDRGWKFTVPANQKILADSLTFNDEIFFVGFSPDTNAAAQCSTGRGTNFLYRVSVANGDPIVPNLDTLDPLLADDARRTTLAQGGIAPSPAILFPSADAGCTGAECALPPIGCIGVECFDPGFTNNPVLTLWTQDGIE